jgi:hypothetical protein
MRRAKITHLAVVGTLGCCLPTAVRAEPRIVHGGPPRPAEREAAVRALTQAVEAAAVCWRGDRPDRVQLELRVGSDGEIKQSRARTRGKVATCAAAVLAVQNLSEASIGYTVIVEVDTRATSTRTSSAGGGAAGDRVAAALRGDRAVTGCYENRPELEGDVLIRFVIRPPGKVLDPEVARSTLTDPDVAPCLVRAVRTVDLRSLGIERSIEFALPLHFSGTRAPARGSAGDPSLQPQKTGPLSGEVLGRVMDQARPRFTRCYEQQMRRTPRLAGDVVIRYTVRADGTTRNVEVKRTTLNSPPVERCMIKVGQSLRFPGEADRADTKVIYPFRFAARPQ